MSQIQMAAYRHIFRRYRQYEYSAEIACIGLQFLKYGHRLITDIDKKLCLKLRAIRQVSYQTCIAADFRPRLFSANQAVNTFCLRNHISAASSLSLHSAGAVAAHELGHVGNIHAVEVADD